MSEGSVYLCSTVAHKLVRIDERRVFDVIFEGQFFTIFETEELDAFFRILNHLGV
jgi:hypothetical protein